MELQRLLLLIFKFVLFIIVFFSLPYLVKSESDEIQGCGGFVRSPYPIDFDKIEIKLFTKQGNLKMKTECPPTGYYFIPLESKGDYVLKISPPEGWIFDPPNYEIKYDKKTDICSKGIDINFDFKGFSIFGKVPTKGFSDGPAGLTLALKGPGNLEMSTITGESGSFLFDSIPPGDYSIKVLKHPLITIEKDSHSFTISNKNIQIENEILVSGYEVSGKIQSNSNAVEGVNLVLIGEKSNSNIKGCNPEKIDSSLLPQKIEGKVLCLKSSDKNGKFMFNELIPGKYTIIPVYRGKNVVYNLKPDQLSFQLGHSSLLLEPPFEVEGFTVKGRVKGLPDATILVNGEVKAKSKSDGSFTIPKMNPGTYEFEILAEKYQFDKTKVTITVNDPTIPDFNPSRFLICGHIEMNETKKKSGQLSIAFEKLSENGQSVQNAPVYTEKVQNPKQICTFLPEGIYSTKVDSGNNNYYFVSQNQKIRVPGSTFSFKEFMGSVSGIVDCPNCVNLKVQIKNKASDSIIGEQILQKGNSFTFDKLESDDYIVQVIQPKYCWKEETINVKLTDQNVQNLKFVQTGYQMEISTTHETKVKITEIIEKDKKVGTNLEISVLPKATNKICLTEGNYKIEPIGCHEFDQKFYNFKTSDGNEVKLKAVKHKFFGKIVSPGKIIDLVIKLNGKEYDVKVGNELFSESIFEGRVEYDIGFVEESNKEMELEIFSYGFIFEPNLIKIRSKDTCEKDAFKIFAKKSHVIKGKLSPPLQGAEIRIDLIGDPDSTTYVTSNANGEYIAGPFIHNTGFKVTPELQGYTFRPLPNDEYSFTVLKLAKIQVKIEDNGEPLPSVLLSLSGPNSYRQNKASDSNGEMNFGDLQPGPYYLKALLKEFTFEPSSIQIDLNEQETKQYTLKARRESFSLYGQLTSLSGDFMPNLIISAKGIGNCSEYGEEGTSDEYGVFRIWALKSYCKYEITVVKKDDFALRVERTIPNSLELQIGSEDIQNVLFVIITPVRRMDISLTCLTNNEKGLESLRAEIHSAKSPEVTLHSVPFNGVSYIILPPVPKDSADYFITFESSLSKYHYVYQLPKQINFTASKAYSHFNFEFNIDPAPVDQEIGKNSYFGLAFIVLAIILIANFEKLSEYVKILMDNYSNAASSAQSKKSKSKKL